MLCNLYCDFFELDFEAIYRAKWKNSDRFLTQSHTWHFVLCSHTVKFMCRPAVPGRGGGGALDFHLDGRVPLGGWKPDPVSNRSAHKKYTLSQYTLLNFYMHTLYWYGQTLYSAVYHHTFIKISCVPRAPSLVPRSQACHKHCGPARTVAGAEIVGLS